MTQTLIEKHGLEKFISRIEDQGLADRLQSIPLQFSWLEKEGYNNLRRALQKKVHTIYPEIDLSFLTMQNTSLGIALFNFRDTIEHQYLKTIIRTRQDFFNSDEWHYLEKEREVEWMTGLPQFSVFSIQSSSPEFRIDIRPYRCSLPPISPQFYKDIFQRQYQKMKLSIGRKRPKRILPILPQLEGERFNLVDHFVGIIPEGTRNKIKGATHVFGYSDVYGVVRPAEVYIVKEAESWSLAPVSDPLVIGVQGEKAYLIDQFDTTPIEQYVVDEFAIKGEEV